VHGWWKRKMVQPLWKNNMVTPQTIKTELPHDPFLGIYPKELKSGPQRDSCTPVFIYHNIIHKM
jgi:hypothetical protein